MGEVLAGHDEKLDRPVAIKRLRTDRAMTDERRRRLELEARLNARLSHPNVVHVYDFVSSDGADHIVTEYVEGQRLDELCKRERPTVDHALKILAAVARGLDAAHRMGIVHRDLKLENVLVGRDGEAKIVDFGIATMHDAAVDGSEIGPQSGTLATMSPEQSSGGEVDARSDLFSFGVLAYELLTGVSPFGAVPNAATTGESGVRRTRAQRPVREIATAVPPQLSSLIDRLLDERPELRPATARDVEMELEALVTSARQSRRSAPDAGILFRQVATVSLHPPTPTGEIEQVAARLVEWHRRVREIASRYQAHLVVAPGRDALVCVGYPRVYGDNCAVAASLVSELASDADLSTLAAGIDVGKVAVLDQPNGPVVVGAAIDVAVALGRGALPGDVLVTAAAQRILSRSYRLSPVDRMAAASSTVVYRIDAPLDTEAHGAMVASTFVGRDGDLAALRDHELLAFGPDARTRGRAVVVVGVPGAGKSRLVRTFLAETSAARVVIARGTEQTRSTAFAPFTRLLRELSELRGEHARPNREAIVRCVGELPSGSPEMVAVVAHLTGVQTEEDERSLAQAATYERHAFVADHLGRFLVELLASDPSLIVIEDLTWFDTSSLDAIAVLGLHGRGQRLFALATSRPGTALEQLPEVFARHELLPLDAIAAAQLVNAAARGWVLPPRIARTILERAAGVPLLVEELTQFVAHRAADSSGTATIDIQSIPTTFADAILERFQDLAAPTQRVAQLAASIGNEVDEALLLAVTALGRDELRTHIELLSREGFLHSTGFGERRGYAFRHALTRDALYDAQDVAVRTATHRTILAKMDAMFPDSATTMPEAVALQCEGAGDLERAVRARAAAGQRAVEQWSPTVACEHFEAALRAIAKASSEDWAVSAEIDVRKSYGAVLSGVTGWGSSQANANNARLRELSTRTDVPLDWTSVYLSCLADLGLGAADELSSKLGWLALQIEDASAESDGGLKRYLLSSLRGILSVYAGYLVRARAELMVALDLRQSLLPVLRTFPLPEPMINPRMYLAWVELLEGNVEAAFRFQREEEVCHEVGSRAHVAACSYGAALSMAAHNWSAARTRAALVVESEAELEQPTYHGQISQMTLQLVDLRERCHSGPIAAADVDTCINAARTAFDRHREELKMRVGNPLFISFQAQVCVEAAREQRGSEAGAVALTQAKSFVEELLSLAAEGNVFDRYIVSEVHRLHAEVLELEGRPDDAARAWAEARRRAKLLVGAKSVRQLFLEARIEEHASANHG